MNTLDSRITTLLHMLTDSSQPQEAATQELAEILYDPGVVERMDVLGEGHWFREQALILSDALESVTNGMHNPAAMEALYSVQEKTPLACWKHFILGLYSLYQGEAMKAAEYLDRIPADAAPARAVPVLRAFINPDRTEEELQQNKELTGLLDELKGSSDLFEQNCVQIDDALEHGLFDTFTDTCMLMISDLMNESPEAAKALALWGINTLVNLEESPSDFIGAVRQVFGEAETRRLSALVFLDTDTDISLLFWLKYMVAYVRNEHFDPIHCAAWIETALDMVKDLPYYSSSEDEEAQDFFSGVTRLATVLLQELNPFLPGTIDRISLHRVDQITDFFTKLYNRLSEQTGLTKKELPSKEEQPVWDTPERQSTPRETIEPVQLELF